MKWEEPHFVVYLSFHILLSPVIAALPNANRIDINFLLYRKLQNAYYAFTLCVHCMYNYDVCMHICISVCVRMYVST